MKKHLILCVFILGTIFSQAQDNKLSPLNKINQHSISLEPIAVSYTYVRQIKPLLNLGLKLSVGAGFGVEILPSDRFADNGIIDYLKIQALYRWIPNKRIYLDAGPHVSFSFVGETGGIMYGLETSVFYLIKRFHIGFKFQGVFYTENFDTYSEDRFSLFVNPIIIGINL